MKCEICHKADAQEAIVRGEGDDADELYVCSACAKAERQRRQRKSLRTRKVTGLPPGMSMSITEITPVSQDGDESGGDESGAEGESEAPPFLGAIMDAFSDIVNGIESARQNAGAAKDKSSKTSHKEAVCPVGGLDPALRTRGRIHLEGLHLVGELEPVKRAVRALGGELRGFESDGVRDSGHAFEFRHTCQKKRAARVLSEIARQEEIARGRLLTELPRVFADSLGRALAIMKNCRLLSPGELFDLLSPLRLAAKEKLLDGIALPAIEKMMADVDLSGSEDSMDQEERDGVDAARADEMNALFEDVMLNERAEEIFK